MKVNKRYIPEWAGLSDAAISQREGMSQLWNELQFYVEPIRYSGRSPYWSSPKEFQFAHSQNTHNTSAINIIHSIAKQSSAAITSFIIPAFEQDIVIEPVIETDMLVKRWFYQLSRAVTKVLKSPFTNLSNTVQGCILRALHYGNCCLRVTSGRGIFKVAEEDIFNVYLDVNPSKGRTINKLLVRMADLESYDLYEAVETEASSPLWIKKTGDLKNPVITEEIFTTELIYARFCQTVEQYYGVGPGIESLQNIRRYHTNFQDLEEVSLYLAKPAMISFSNEKEIKLKAGEITHVSSANVGITNSVTPTALINRTLTDERLFQMAQMRLASLKEAYLSDIAMIPELPNMTATEISARLERKISDLHPVLQNLQKELILPTVISAAQFVIEESRKKNFINTYLDRDAPIDLETLTKSEITYTSRFELLARKRQLEGITMLANSLPVLAQLDPNMSEKIDTKQFTEAIISAFALDPAIIKTNNSPTQAG